MNIITWGKQKISDLTAKHRGVEKQNFEED